jgi:hypothetical protein
MKGYSALVLVAVLFVAGSVSAVAAEPAAPYTLDVVALTGPQGGDLTIQLDATDGSAVPEAFEHVHVKLHRPGATETEVVNLNDVPARDGAATVGLGPLERGTAVEVQAQVRDEKPPRIVVLREETTALLRPDLVVSAVHAPPQTLSTRPVDVVADLTELNGDVGAKATVELMLGPTPVAEAKTVTIPKGGSLSVAFADVPLTAAMTTELTVVVNGAAPFETDDTNNSRARTIEVTEHELARTNVLVSALAGYGLQFNNHVYAPITPWPHDEEPADDYEDFEAKAIALQPHIVRIFYNDRWDGNADGGFPEWPLNYASFVRSVHLAQEAGATIDISFQNLGIARFSPGASMAKFADVIEDLVVNEGLTNVRWAEVGNEPNSGGAANVSLAEYQALVLALDAELRARGLDDEVRLMGPGLVENAGVAARTHYEWTKWLATNLGNVLDAWGEHVYWNYNDAGRLEYRLRDTWHLMNEELPVVQRKPVYLMEFGIRGVATCGTKPSRANMYYAGDPSCPEIWRTRIAGFQQLWFAIGSAQLGFTGASKWDAYWGVYDRTLNPPQVYWTIGPASEGSPLTPSYYALALLFHTTSPGWQVVRVDPWDDSDWSVSSYGIEGHSSLDTPEKELAGYLGLGGELTVLGLDTNGRALDGVSPDLPARYSIGGLPANTNLELVVWNASGDGTNSHAGTVATNAAGVARFEVPLHAAFALTTVPVS